MDLIDHMLMGVNPILGSTIALGKTMGERYEKLKNPSILKYNTENVLSDNTEILLGSADSEKRNQYLIPDALALSCDIYAVCAKDSSTNTAYHTKSFSSINKGWVYLEDYFKNQNAFAEVSNNFHQFCLEIRNLKFIDNDKSGLGSGIFFQYINSKLIRIAYVTKGTATRKDALTDLEQGWKGRTPQYQLSLSNAKRIYAAMNRHLSGNGYLYYFGHSLGGGLANYNAMGTNIPAVTFNAASVHPDNVSCYVDNYNFLIKSNSMIGIYVEGEILSTKASPLVGLPKNGNRYRVTIDAKYLTGSDNPIAKHLLEPLCATYGLGKMNWKNKIFIEI